MPSQRLSGWCAGRFPTAVFALGLALSVATPGVAADFTVDDTADRIDLNPGIGGCATTAGTCTLRAAIQEANALAGTHTITLPAGLYRLTIPGKVEDAAATGDLDITRQLDIIGAGAGTSIVDGNGLDRVFDVLGGQVTISGLTIRGGSADLDNPESSGGGVRVWSTAVSLDLERCEVVDNLANIGGGIFGFSGSVLAVLDSLIANNEAADLGFTNARGAAIYTEGEIDVEGTTVMANRGVITPGTGAIQALDSNVSITNSTVAKNQVGGFASHNSNVDIVNATIVDNQLGLWFTSFNDTHSLSVKNTILADNGPDCSVQSPPPALLDFAGEHNLDSDGTCPWDGSPNDLPNTAPQLGPLLTNGGIGPTFVPLVGSPVIDAGNNSTCEASDQRDAPRPLDGDGTDGATCDIGAVEFLPCVTAVPDLVVENLPPLDSAFTATACFSVTLGPGLSILNDGGLVVRARDLLVLRNGVEVHAGGLLTLVRDPAAGSGIALPGVIQRPD